MGDELSDNVNLGVFRPGEARVWDHAIQPMIRVYGTVTGEQTGVPIESVRISYEKNGELLEGPYLMREESYELRLFEPGDYFIFPEYNSWTRDVTRQTHGVHVSLAPGDEREINFKLPDQFEMAVRVVDPSGQPIPFAQCDYYRITPQGTGMYGFTQTDDTGYAAHRFVPEYESWFHVQHEGYVSAHSTHVVGEPGAVYPEETIVLHPSSGVEGIVTDATGAAMAGVELKVSVRAPGLRYATHGFVDIDTIEVTTDARGYFAIGGGLPAARGDVHIEIHLQNNEWSAAGVVEGVELSAGAVSDLGAVALRFGE
jgi:hypothetical protein